MTWARGSGRGGQGAGVDARSGDLLKHVEALQYNCQVWLTHCVGEQNAPWRHGYIVGMSGECRGSESVKICPGKVSAVLGSARKGNGHSLKPVCQNLSLECPNISQGEHSMLQKCEGNTLKPVRKWPPEVAGKSEKFGDVKLYLKYVCVLRAGL